MEAYYCSYKWIKAQQLAGANLGAQNWPNMELGQRAEIIGEMVWLGYVLAQVVYYRVLLLSEQGSAGSWLAGRVRHN